MNPLNRTYSKKQLRSFYEVSEWKFTQMLKGVPDLDTGFRSIIYPAELKLIVDIYGEPNWTVEK